MPIEFYFTPELHLKDGRIIRDLDDAASFAREQEVRPGVDQRDEVLHKIERAEIEKPPMQRRTRSCDGWRNSTFWIRCYGTPGSVGVCENRMWRSGENGAPALT